MKHVAPITALALGLELNLLGAETFKRRFAIDPRGDLVAGRFDIRPAPNVAPTDFV